MDFLATEIKFTNSNYSQQRTIQSFAHYMGLDFEYSSVTHTTIITKATPFALHQSTEAESIGGASNFHLSDVNLQDMGD
jgi:hypothetical protein